MNNEQITPKSKKMVYITLSVLYALTAFHHVYGGVLYDTSWRIQGVFVFGILFVLTLFLTAKADSNKTMKIVALTIIGFLWIFMIGIYEGGYNHVLKNILYGLNVSPDLLHTLYPSTLAEAKLYEAPNDFLFEATGVIQFPVSLWAIYAVWKAFTTKETK